MIPAIQISSASKAVRIIPQKCFVLVLVALMLTGCSRVEPPQPSAGEVTLRVADERDLAAILARERGKVVLVDFWATWCIPCLELLPHTIQLRQQYAERGLAVVTVSFDASNNEAAVREILRSKQALTENLLSRYGASPQSVEAFEAGDGALPVLKLYDRQGHLAKSFGSDNPPEPKAIDQAVEALLAR
jgi:thiol-disulfide isomerase/thioredoxin